MPDDLPEIIDPNKPSPDIKLISRAVREGWQIPPALMSVLPNVLAKLALSSNDDRVRINAAKVLVAMAAQDKPRQVEVTVQPKNTDLYD
ncbi:MAG: hypothetical protein EBR82_23625 [Caulobacteraceae bacterium]|nr:hypothetical protein [Caulobacteraceae bacterium]